MFSGRSPFKTHKRIEPQGRKTLRGQRRSSGRPRPDHADTRTNTYHSKQMPPANRCRAPALRSYYSSHSSCPLPHRLKRGGVVRAGAVGCLTEPGIVCFPADHRSKRINVSNLKDGKHYEASEGVPAGLVRTAPTRALTPRPNHVAAPPHTLPRSSQRTNRSIYDSLLAFSGFLAHAKNDFPP